MGGGVDKKSAFPGGTSFFLEQPSEFYGTVGEKKKSFLDWNVKFMFSAILWREASSSFSWS